MNRLSVRLLASHGLVAVVGAAVGYVVVRALAPGLYDMRVHGQRAMAHDMPGDGLRAAALSATSTALLMGVLAGLLTAAVVGAYASVRIMRPLRAVSAATHRMAEGDYAEPVTEPRERELAAVAADVNALASRLADTEARRVRLLGEVAHEMRTPLAVVDGYLEGLVDGVFPADPDVLGEMGAEVRRLHRLADDLSALSRAEEGRLELRLAPVDLADVAAGAAARLRPQLQDAGVELRVVRTGPLPVRGDPDRLAQVITNLLGNALVATGPGGHVTVTARRTDGRGSVTVSDDGVGLAPEDLGRVFERFYRVRGGARRGNGSGIGLTIARGIAVAHGGDLVAASAGLGRGATFTLTVPLARG